MTRDMKLRLGVLVGAAVLGAGIGLYTWWAQKAPDAVEQATLPVPAPEPNTPAIRNPVPEEATAAATPLPPLNESDPVVLESLTQVAGAEPVTNFLVPNDIVRKIVATIDNLPREELSMRVRALQPTRGAFAVDKGAESITLDARNFERYTPFVSLVANADTKQFVDLYFRFYPLFQRAYQDLGNPDAYFNDRVIEVIDHLLAAPDINADVALVQPKVFYEFADPDLESRSAGQKTLMRMGPDNAKKIKAKLRELRTALTERSRQ